jgi:hypothetical protein
MMLKFAALFRRTWPVSGFRALAVHEIVVWLNLARQKTARRDIGEIVQAAL